MSTESRAVLFTDMEASTEFSLRHGDEDAVALLRVHEDAVRDPVADHGGTVIKNTGDGFLAVFPTSAQGVRAALDIRARIEDYNARAERPLRVRLGLHAGPLIETDGDVFGLTVSTAARITSKAQTGQLLVSDAVRLAAPGGEAWAYSDHGSFWLKGLREKWRLHEVAPPGEAIRAAPAVGDQLPFVGRDGERALLRRSVDAAADGRGSMVVVTGGAGSGKTRLVDEVGREATARGVRFVSGRCHDATQTEPYAALVDIAEAIEQSMSAGAFREVLGASAGEVARLLPHLRERYDDVAAAAETAGAETRRYFFVNVRDVLARLAAERPLVVLFDDLQWADVSTLLFLEHLADDLAELPILIVGVYTLEVVSAEVPLHGTLTRLHQRRALDTITLDPLTRDDIEAILTRVAGSQPPSSLVHALYDATQGNAFFVGEIVRQLLEQSDVLGESGWRPDVTLADLAVPEGVRLVVESRFAKLEPGTQKMLGVASVLGRDFSVELLEELFPGSEEELLDAIDEAEEARLISSMVEAASVRFEFEHELIRQTLLGQLSHTRVQRLHARVADAIEAVYADSLASHAATIASHLDQAGRSAPAERRIRFHTLAGDRAIESAAYEDAVRHFEQVLELTPNDDPAGRASILERLATAHRSLGDLERALALWGKALDGFDAAGDAAAVARASLDAAMQVAWWRQRSDVNRLVQRGMDALDDEPSATRAGLLAVSGMLASQTGDFERGQELLDEALTLARRQDNGRIVGLTLYAAAVHHFGYQRFRETIELGLESVDHLRAAGDLWGLANILGYVGAAHAWIGEFAQAARVGGEGEDLALRLGNWSAFVFCEQARVFQAIGNAPSATALEGRGRRALDLGQDMGFGWLASIGHARIGLARFWSGEWGEALIQFEAAARIEVRGAAGGHLGRLMLIHAYLGDRDTARSLVERARVDFPVPGRPTTGTSWGLAASAVEVFALLGARDEAAALSDAMDELAATGITMRTWDFRLLSTLRGIAATCAGDFDRAAAHFDEALEMSRTLPMRREEPEACRFYAQMRTERNEPGDREAAAELRRRAIAGYEQFAMPAHAALVRTSE